MLARVHLRISLIIGVFTALVSACQSPSTVPLTDRPNLVTAAGGGQAAGGSQAAPVKKGFDGLACKGDEECESGHCSNKICCSRGDCCKVAEDCGVDTKDSLVCDDSATCQGTRGSVSCTTAYRCAVMEGGIQDDSGCNAKTEADDCGLYKSVFCDGTKDQKAPKCPDACTTNDECDEGAHCAGNKCIANLPNGGACTADTDCMGAHCDHGFCCAMGDCCMADTDCDPTKYSAPPSCTDPKMCQGTSMAPACMDNQCGTRMSDDDSACDRNVISDECGGLPVKCRGGADQQAPPPCATGTCGGFGRATCNEGAFCWQGKCTPDQPDGESCTVDDSCQSGHCANNVCCSEGDCCTSDDQCKPVKMCTDPSNCKGQRQEFHCDVEHGKCEKSGEPKEDSSSCVGQVAGTDCGLNPPARCTAAEKQEQPPKSACPRCTTTPTCTGGCYPFGPTTCVAPPTPSAMACMGTTPPPNCGKTYECGSGLPLKPVGCTFGATKCTAGICGR